MEVQNIRTEKPWAGVTYKYDENEEGWYGSRNYELLEYYVLERHESTNPNFASNREVFFNLAKIITLFWNGARWLVWIKTKNERYEPPYNYANNNYLLVGEPTEYKDKNNPPMEWALQMYDLT